MEYSVYNVTSSRNNIKMILYGSLIYFTEAERRIYVSVN